jgi:radical SAM protein with 4Fe4S-binding SPASM domain
MEDSLAIQLHISTSGYCNAKCHFCPYNSDENKATPKGFMTWPLYEKIIRDAATSDQIDNIAFSGLQEPLTDKLLEKRVALAKELRPDWFVELYTNATMLTPVRFDALRDAGLDCISCSLNAVTQAQHFEVMGLKDKFQETCENIRYARANRGKMRMLVKAVINLSHFTIEHALMFQGIWGKSDEGDGVGQVVLESNWAGAVSWTADEARVLGLYRDELIGPGNKTDFNRMCARAMAQYSVHWDGRVGLCCFDPLVKYEFGDLRKQTLKEVYNSPDYVNFRVMHQQNRAAEHPLCAKCTRV